MAGIEDAARRVDHEPVVRGGTAGLHRATHISALCADARHEEGHPAGTGADVGELFGVGRADDQQTVAAGVPFLGDLLGDHLIKLAAVDHEVLELPRPSVRGAAEDHDAFVAVLQKRLDRIAPEVGVHGDGIGTIALEGLAGVLLGGAADVAAFGIEDHRHAGRALADVAQRIEQLVFGADCGVMRDLGFIGADEVGGGVDDGAIEGEDGIRSVTQVGGEALDLGIEPDADP